MTDEKSTARSIEPPIFVCVDGTLDAFDSAENAEGYVEPVDVQSGDASMAFDAQGQRLELFVIEEQERLFFWQVTRERTKIRVAAEQPTDAEEYRQILVCYLERRGPTFECAQKSFRELIDLAFPLARTR